MTRPAPFARNRTIRLPLGLEEAPTTSFASALTAILLVVVAIEVALGSWPSWVRAAMALGVLVLASVSPRLVSRRRPPRGWLMVDDVGVRRTGAGGEAATLVDWSEPFGATVHASADRATFVIALTTHHSARFVSARVKGVEDAASAPTLIERATTAAPSDLRVDEGTMLRAADAEILLRAIAERAPKALDRVYLSDATGRSVVLERGELSALGRRIDLSAPVEWRASIFQERGTHVATVCQATWVRQGDAEFVLVAPLPGDGTWVRDAGAVLGSGNAPAGRGPIHGSVARDLRLMQAPISEPPPRELRCAIDRLFMLPLRRALDSAPRQEHARGHRGRSPRASHP